MGGPWRLRGQGGTEVAPSGPGPTSGAHTQLSPFQALAQLFPPPRPSWVPQDPLKYHLLQEAGSGPTCHPSHFCMLR